MSAAELTCQFTDAVGSCSNIRSESPAGGAVVEHATEPCPCKKRFDVQSARGIHTAGTGGQQIPNDGDLCRIHLYSTGLQTVPRDIDNKAQPRIPRDAAYR